MRETTQLTGSDVTVTQLASAVAFTVAGRDSYWRASLRILTAGCSWRFFTDPRIWRHVEMYEDAGQLAVVGLDFEAMDAEPWTGAERIMVRAAGCLFNATFTVDLNELLLVDDANRRLLLEALDVRAGGMWSADVEATLLHDHAAMLEARR
jgi:hypothetical protein